MLNYTVKPVQNEPGLDGNLLLSENCVRCKKQQCKIFFNEPKVNMKVVRKMYVCTDDDVFILVSDTV